MLTPRRSFILQIDSDADLRNGEIFGRVEHVVSGEVRRFRSLAALLELLQPSAWEEGGSASGEGEGDR